MKRYLFFLLVFCFSQNGFTQSFNYENFANQMIKKANNLGTEIGRNLQQSSQFAMRSTKKEIYILYLDGSKMAVFTDEWSCKSQINSIKSQLRSLMDDFISNAPREAPRADLQKAMNNYINSLNFSYRKEINPNYKEPQTTATIGFNVNQPGGGNTPQTTTTRSSVFTPAPQPQPQQTTKKDSTANSTTPLKTPSLTSNKEPQKENGIRILSKSSGGRTSVYIDPETARVNTGREGAYAPTFQDYKFDIRKDYHYSQMRVEMEQIAKNIQQLDRFIKEFCKSSTTECEYYQEKENLLLRLNELLIEEKQMMISGSISEIERLEQKKLWYEQELLKCKTPICERDMNREINRMVSEIKNEMANIAKENYYPNSGLAKNYLHKHKEPEMSHADQQCEIGFEMMKRGDKEAGLRKIETYAPIVTIENASEKVDNFVQENKEAIKNYSLEAGEFVVLTGVTVAAYGLAEASLGASLVIKPVVDYKVSEMFNKLKGQEDKEARINALVSTAQSQVIGLGVGRVVALTPLKEGAKSTIIIEESIGTVFDTGINYYKK
jgi:hypothetical protein